MPPIAKSHPVRRPSAPVLIECLEGRTLLNATLTSAIAPVSGSAGSSTMINLNSHFSDPNVTGTPVLIQTTQGNIPITLFDSQVGTTVQNFLHYVNSGEYNGTFIHRVVTVAGGGIGIVQGGGYTPDENHIATTTAIPLQYQIPNSTGTIAMARTSVPNSATSEWFFNAADNSQTLGQSNGGGYAVFGKALYGGLQAVQNIYSLPLTAYPPTFASSVPVMNYSGGTVMTSNLVIVNSVSVVPALTFQASSDNPSLVSPSVSGGNLTLTFGSGIGTAHITVTSTDLGGNVATTTFAVGVGITQVNVGKGTATKLVRFTDADGTVSQLSVNGPGVATLSLTGSGLTQSTKHGITTVTGAAQGVSISTAGTTGASTLNITGHGGNGVVNVAGLTTDGSLRAINGPNTALTGTDTINGSIGALTLDSLIGGTFSASGIGRLVVRGAIDSSTIRVSGNIASITAGSITNSKIYAGVGTLPAGQNLPASLSDFAAAAAISSVKVGRGGFANADIAAQTLGNLSLGTIQTSNSGAALGVAGHSLRSLTGVAAGKHLRLQRIATQADVTSQLTKEGVALQDMVIRTV